MLIGGSCNSGVVFCKSIYDIYITIKYKALQKTYQHIFIKTIINYLQNSFCKWVKCWVQILNAKFLTIHLVRVKEAIK